MYFINGKNYNKEQNGTVQIRITKRAKIGLKNDQFLPDFIDDF